jgi:hypothetical protein
MRALPKSSSIWVVVLHKPFHFSNALAHVLYLALLMMIARKLWGFLFLVFFFLNENVNVVVCKVELEVASFTLMKACIRFYQAQRPCSNFIC